MYLTEEKIPTFVPCYCFCKILDLVELTFSYFFAKKIPPAEQFMAKEFFHFMAKGCKL
jgi:hypothetical protein